jgi:hypothetical protein
MIMNKIRNSGLDNVTNAFRRTMALFVPWLMLLFIAFVGCKGNAHNDKTKTQDGETLAPAGMGIAGNPKDGTNAFYGLYGDVQKLQSDYQAALDNATNSIPCAVEFARLFPRSASGFSYYIGGAGPTSFYMHADLYERYELTMVVRRIIFDATRRKVTGFSEPEFDLREVAGLKQITKTGTFGSPTNFVTVTNWSVSYNPKGQLRFGEREWKAIVAAHGDFPVIGYTFITNSPVPSFREYRDRQKNQ